MVSHRCVEIGHQVVLGNLIMRALLIWALNTQLVFAGTGPAPSAETNITPGLQAERFGDWAVVCGKSSADPDERVCEIMTMITAAGQTAPFARLALLPQNKNKPARLIAILPVAVSIAPGVNFTLDSAKPGINLIYKFCAVAACFAEAELAEKQMTIFRNRLPTGRLAFSDPNGKKIEVEVSLRGFDQALDSLLRR